MSWERSFKGLFSGFVDVLYPPICLHCGKHIPGTSEVFCEDCSELLSPIDEAQGRCPHCFSKGDVSGRHACRRCRGHERLIYRYMAVFDYLGPAATLVKRMKYSHLPYLAKGAGAYMAAQLLSLGWQLPDVIVPVPLSFSHWLTRGYNQSFLLAERMSEILHCPVKEALVRSSLDFSQAGLNNKQRQELKKESFSLKNGVNLADQTVLLVDDVATTGTTLQHCASALLSDCPARISAITLCTA